MPNWCYNEMIVRGSKEVLDAVMGKVHNSQRDEFPCFDFGKVAPYPEKYKKLDDESNTYDGFNGVIRDENGEAIGHMTESGYEWCIRNWGTKWNACEPSLDVYDEYIVYSFNTAWSPSTPVTIALSEMFPDATFIHCYEEEGMDFSGREEYKNGVLVSEVMGNYDDYPITEHPVWDDDGNRITE